jgi:hypothetical protein
MQAAGPLLVTSNDDGRPLVDSVQAQLPKGASNTSWSRQIRCMGHVLTFASISKASVASSITTFQPEKHHCTGLFCLLLRLHSVAACLSMLAPRYH